nr:protein kinase family protein [Nocardioides perillae]
MAESAGARFWRAHDRVLARHVAVHVVATDDPRAERLLDAARASAAVHDRRVLRVLDADRDAEQVYVVNEWGAGTSLDLLLSDGPLGPRRAAFVAAEAADALAAAHAAGIAHGRLVPENVLVDHAGHVRLIGLAVDAALHGLPPGHPDDDLVDLAGLLYAGLTARWAGTATSRVEAAPRDAARVLRPRRVRAGVPRSLDHLCDGLLNDRDATSTGGLPAFSLATTGAGPFLPRGDARPPLPATAGDLATWLTDFVGDPAGLAASLATAAGPRPRTGPGPLPDTPALGTPAPAPHHPAPAPHDPAPADRDPGPAPQDRPAEGAAPPAEAGAADDGPSALDAPTRVVPLAAGGGAGAEPGAASAAAAPAGEPTVAEPRPEPTVAEPRPDPTVAEERPEPGSSEHPAGPPASTRPAGDPAATDLPTEAGVPIFHDDDVDWLRSRAVQPPPPPPFEEVPERPLFAPDPAPGEPLRRPRPGAATAPPSDDHWPWGDTGSGTGSTAPMVTDEPEEDDRVPGRRTLRVALLLALVLVTALAVVSAFDLGRGVSPLGSADDPEDEPSATATPLEALTGLTATDLDPQGDPPEENPDLAPLVVDGDPGTAWRTSTYAQQLGPAGLKTGVGLVVDLGRSATPREVVVTTQGGPTTAQLYLADGPPDAVAGLDVVARASGEGELTFELDGAASGTHLVVWLTSLPPVPDGFRGEVAEVEVRG